MGKFVMDLFWLLILLLFIYFVEVIKYARSDYTETIEPQTIYSTQCRLSHSGYVPVIPKIRMHSSIQSQDK